MKRPVEAMRGSISSAPSRQYPEATAPTRLPATNDALWLPLADMSLPPAQLMQRIEEAESEQRTTEVQYIPIANKSNITNR